ncbi:sulfate ABC transporter substrate-binding protein [Psychrobacter sp. N25K4-3-2]|uniref:sulfate ABC transporter substrate-binding protein n=1 Tax=Psychrobacter sp. N25K4-3-2 TaxID=2785026 RepID=UPI00188AA1B6|nr:sulfate ABC transporter substrate-binding protein [Psychrobacter sp. N25K4-3-2]MBF4488395.1 sulfate ABC transporter substrate-binding protein [Psychrobacter sp. N25K4-3-2]
MQININKISSRIGSIAGAPSLSKSVQPRILMIGSALTAMMLIAGCSPTQATQNESASAQKDISLLNVSYDVSRDFYKDYNALFSANYQKENPDSKIDINQSHGGSSKQALSVANGLQADVVTFNQESDMNLLVEKGLVAADWQQALPNNAVPYTSTMVLLVRNGNPKNIQDWSDLARNGIDVVIPNPKTSGTARYAFLGAYGYGLHQFKENVENPTKTDDFIKKLLANVVTYDNGARAATTSFTQRGLGDVLITTENEAHLAVQQFAKGKVDIVYPSYSIVIKNPVAVVTAVTEKGGKTEAATAYLKGLWDTPAQELMAQMYMRPSNEQVLAAHKDTLPDIDTFEPVEVFGSWAQIMDTFFVDGGRFDQLARVE